MENNYLDCQHGLTPQCPQITNPIMSGMLAILPNENLTADTMEEVDKLCRACDSFTPRE